MRYQIARRFPQRSRCGLGRQRLAARLGRSESSDEGAEPG